MKKTFPLTVILALISVSIYSQRLLPQKTLFKGNNAIIISETQMDSINLKYLKYNLLNAKHNFLKLQIDTLQLKLDKSYIKRHLIERDNQNLTNEKLKLIELINVKNQKYKNNEKLWKEKAKGNIKSFLTGASLGALVIAILALLV